MSQKKMPMRMCVGCRGMIPKKELIRVVRDPEGNVHLDRIGKASGRGAYLCGKAECFAKARKIKALERAFGCAIDPAVYEELEKEFADGQ